MVVGWDDVDFNAGYAKEGLRDVKLAKGKT